ncbi:MAG: DUF2934 domain-containing protein [Gammaproteobacteria bacterium]
MSKSAPSGRAKRSRTTDPTTTTQTPASRSHVSATATVSAEQRHAMIAERAYFRAAARRFDGGDAVTDWLASEHDVDALLSRSSD